MLQQRSSWLLETTGVLPEEEEEETSCTWCFWTFIMRSMLFLVTPSFYTVGVVVLVVTFCDI